MSDKSWDYRAEVDATALREAVVRLVQMGGRRGAPKVALELRKDGIAIEWGGVFEELPARGRGELIVGIAPTDFTGLAARLPKSGPVQLGVIGEDFYLGETSLSCQHYHEPLVRPGVAKKAEPAEPLDLLLLHFKQNEEELAEAGLTKELDSLREQARQSVIAAAKRLSWLDIDASLLAAWVEEHLAARARGEQSFPLGEHKVVVDQKGQVLMFDLKKR